MHTKQALFLLAYGTPETAKDIEPYYTDIRHGHPPEAAQLYELQKRYQAIGGKTPLLTITREQARLLEQKLNIPVFIGMKHWHPYIADTVKNFTKKGITDIIALVLAPHYSIMSIGDYEKKLNLAIDTINPEIRVLFIKQWGDNPIFIDSLCQRIEETRKTFPCPDVADIEVVFTAHSLPIKILAMNDPYKNQLFQTCKLVAKKLRISHWRLSFQSAGRTRDTWLGPDILQEMKNISDSGIRQVLIAPIGFTTDNLEILYDLDIQARDAAKKAGLVLKRIPSANTTSRFIDALVNVITPYLYAKE